MRCLNCQIVLMPGDKRCPSCGAYTNTEESSSLQARAEFDPGARAQLIRLKWGFGIFGPLFGAVLLWHGGNALYETLVDPPKAREVTAEELLKIERPEDLKGYISYLPPKQITTGVDYVKLRSGAVSSRFVLLQVRDRWLLAKVAPNAQGARIEGKLEDTDHLATGKLRSLAPNEFARLLPYQLDAEYPMAIIRRQNLIFGGAEAGFGLLLVIAGIGFLAMKVPSSTPERRAATTPGGVPLSTQTPIWVGPDPAPEGRGCLLPAISTMMWAAGFFVVVCFAAIGWIMATSGGDAQESKAAAEELGQTLGPWLFLGSIGLAFLLGLLGKLPGTRR